jgi:hypothetical protein
MESPTPDDSRRVFHSIATADEAYRDLVENNRVQIEFNRELGAKIDSLTIEVRNLIAVMTIFIANSNTLSIQSSITRSRTQA